MSTKKVVILSLFFVIAGFFLTGYIFVDEDGLKADSTDIAKLRAEQKVLIEKVAELEEAIKGEDKDKDKDTEKNENELAQVPEPNKVLVAYVKSEYNGVNTRADIGTNHPVVERVPQKSPMVVIETKDDWYRVKLESGNIAWVASWVVDVQEE